MFFDGYAAGTEGTIEPMQLGSTAATVWNVLNGLGAVLFAYSFSFILLEIQDTIRTKRGVSSGPMGQMKRAVNIAFTIMSSFYVVSDELCDELFTATTTTLL